ncbi:hypothetical protein E2L08_04390 [Palleronia sediminis]|uniref:Sulfotransferase family protein n=1 Tax=Palleronia sediminis TaxID=2547833 RepID=A0A4R6AF32_9RHOB|nr:sulfotransferase family 2 domain-containing protein [Palleronia sediminis]TDL81897.1 hypothetical protein E2L08_04390 [Palleronia sediminis]
MSRHAPAPRLFNDRPAAGEPVNRMMKEARDTHARAFRSPALCNFYHWYWFTPPSGRWAYKPNGKSGTTSTLAFLFWAEFGHPVSTAMHAPGDMNDDAILHRLTTLDLFRRAHHRRDIDSLTGFLGDTTRLTTVRHPATRAISAFRYLSRSHALSHEQFARDRLRMTAVTGMDWTRDADSPEGFERFLDYVAYEIETEDEVPVNNHWGLQVSAIRPDLYPPHAVGRCEALGAFFGGLADRWGLDPARAADFAAAPLNAGGGARAFAPSPHARSRIAEIYAPDFEAFGYDPD